MTSEPTRLAGSRLFAEVIDGLANSCTSWLVVWLPAVAFLANDVFYVFSRTTRPDVALPVALVSGGAQVLTIAGVVRPILLAIGATNPVRPWAAAIGFAASGAVRTVALALLTSVPEDAWARFWWMLPAGVVSAVIWMSATAVLANSYRRTEIRRARLGAEYERLTQTRARDIEALAAADQQLAEVRQTTRAALSQIRDRLHPGITVAELDDVLELVRQVVGDLVRPLSHNLAEMPDKPESPAVSPLWQRRGKVVIDVLRAWPRARPFDWRLVSAVSIPIVLVALLERMMTGHGPELVFAAAALTIQLGFVVLADRLLTVWLRQAEPRLAFYVLAGAYLWLLLVGTLIGVLAVGIGMSTPLEAFLSPATSAMMFGGMAAMVWAREDERQRVAEIVATIEWELLGTRQRLWAQRRRLALALHGRVQANLTAVSLLLGAARDQMAADLPMDPELDGRVWDALDLAARIESVPAMSPAERLDQVARVWSGVLEVSVDLRPAARAALDRDQDVADACVEVLREILLNSVRHSRASSAAVLIGMESGSGICLRVSERSGQREPLERQSDRGVGKSLVASLAADWAETDGEQGRTTVALLATRGTSPGTLSAASRLVDVDGLS